jgi:hypothetical protein
VSALRKVVTVEVFFSAIKSVRASGPSSTPIEMQSLKLECGHVATRSSPPGMKVEPVAWRCLDCKDEVVPIPHCPYCSFPACGHEPCAPRTYVPGEVCQCCGRRVV